MLTKSLSTLAIITLASAATPTLAHEAGDIIVKAGLAHVKPNASSTPIRIDSPNLGESGEASVDVGENGQFGITFTYMYSDNFGVELLAATPFKHDISAAGQVDGVGKLGSTKHLPPTVTLNYFPRAADASIQPYLGVGFNYTVFFEESANSTLNSDGVISALSNLAGGPAITGVNDTKLSLDPSFGLALHAGVDIALTDELGLNFAYWRIDIETDAEITTQTDIGQIEASTKVTVDPNVYMVGLSYRF